MRMATYACSRHSFLRRGRVGFVLLLLSLSAMLRAQSRFDYFYLQAEKCTLADDYASASELYRYCLRLRPDAPEALYSMGLMHTFLREDSVGNRLLLRACEQDSCNAWYQTTLAASYLEKRNTEEVVPVLERLARLKPMHSDVQSQLATIYHSKGDYVRTIEALNHI